MPWTAKDAEGHTKEADTPKLQAMWAKVANSALKEYGDTDEGVGKAIATANAAVADAKKKDGDRDGGKKKDQPVGEAGTGDDDDDETKSGGDDEKEDAKKARRSRDENSTKDRGTSESAGSEEAQRSKEEQPRKEEQPGKTEQPVQGGRRQASQDQIADQSAGGIQFREPGDDRVDQIRAFYRLAGELGIKVNIDDTMPSVLKSRHEDKSFFQRKTVLALKSPKSFDAESREVDAVISTGSAVRRDGWDGPFDEILSMNPENVRMGRLNQGAAVLDSHHWFSGLNAMLGGVVPGSARLENDALVARIKFSRGSALAQRVMQDLADGIQIPLSAGYKVHKSEEDRRTNPITRTITDWEPLEVSLVPVSAEGTGTGFRMQSRGEPPRREASKRKETTMQRPIRTPNESDADFKVRIAEYFSKQEPVENETAQALQKRVEEYFAEVRAAESAVDARREDERRRTADIEAELKRQQDRRERGELGLGDRAGASMKDFFAVARQAGMDIEVAEKLITPGMTIDEFRKVALEYLSKRSATVPTSSVHQPDRDFAGSRYGEISTGEDPMIARDAAMAEALSIRMLASRRIPAITSKEQRDWCEARHIVDNVSLSMRIYDERESPKNPQVREYLKYSLVEIAAMCIDHKFRSGVITPVDGYKILERAWHTRAGKGMHSTGDFPGIFENSLHKSLLARYSVAMPTYREIAAERTFQDFRPHPQVRAGDFPQPQPLTETGEIKYGTAGESKETVSVLPYGIAFSISRQMMVNDDLGAIDQILGSTGNSILRFENATFFAMMLQNSLAGPTLLQDSKPVFLNGAVPTGHNNYADNSGHGSGAPSIATIGAARAALRAMKSIDGQYLNLNPVLILTGPVQETVADQMITQITPALTSSVNPFVGKLRNITEATITGTAWYLFVDAGVLPCFVYGFLAGAGGPRVRTDEPFGTQGVRVSLEHDFGVGAIDYRGAFLNAGA